MSVEKNKAVVSRFLRDVWNERNFAAAEELVAAEYDAGTGTRGPAAATHWVNVFRSAFPDFRIHVHELVAEGDRVVVRYEFAGTQRGPWMGIPASNKRVAVQGATFYQLSDSRIAATWFCYDALGLLQQLHANLNIPPAPPQQLPERRR